MASFVVMEQPAGQGGDRVAFVRDGFHLLAFLLPFPWLLWQRLWIEGLLALAVSMAIGVLGEVEGFGWTPPLLALLVAIYVGMDGAGLRLSALRRRGWVERGLVDAEDLDAAEARYWLSAEARQPIQPEPRLPEAPAVVASPRTSGPALGLLHYPGR